MDNMKEVSVVIPTKNEEKSIGKCIEKIKRIFNDHHIDGEIIVANKPFLSNFLTV